MKHLVLICLAVLVTGCAGTKIQEHVVPEYVYVKVDIPNKFRSPCPVTKPIPIATYNAMSEDDRRNYLSRYVIILLGDAKKCDNVRNGLVGYIDAYNDLHTENK